MSEEPEVTIEEKRSPSAPIKFRTLLEEGREDVIKRVDELKHNKRKQLSYVLQVLKDLDEHYDTGICIALSSGRDSVVIEIAPEDIE